MEQLLPVINQLQEVFSTSGLDSKVIQLPQIVVVGEQSAGKSSVLESLVGRPCLPRGKDIVTRCPIVLQLNQTDDDEAEDYCEFPHLPEGGRKVTNFENVVKVINKEVDKRAGTNKGIIMDALVMKIFSPNVINLTVVDLPGMVKNPTGDQPEDIEEQVEKLLRSYIGNPNSIILAVSAATNDIANSGSLKLAKEVDPELDRTVAVITKLDLMDRGTNATEVLTGKIFPVKLGIVGVVNRSYEDIQNNKTISESIQHEAKFLNEHYSMIASRNGSLYLKAKLQALLLEHIRKCLPILEARLRSLRNEASNEMKVLGREAPVNKSSCLREIIEKFCEAFKSSITGRKFRNIERHTLTGVARLNQIFEDVLTLKLNTVDPLQKLQNEEILNTVANSRALESGLVVTEAAFQDLVREQILLLKEPSRDCASLVRAQILKIVQVCMDCLKAEMRRFPKIKFAIVGVIKDLLKEQHDMAQTFFAKYIDCQASFIKMKQSEFGDEIRQLQQIDDCKISKQSSSIPDIQKLGTQCFQTQAVLEKPDFVERMLSQGSVSSDELPKSELAKCDMIRSLVSKYFETVKSDVRDFWPKVMYHDIIDCMESTIQGKLIDKLLITGDSEKLMTEDKNVAERRKQVVQNLKELENADEVLASIRDPSY